jgi:hypothetical protein
LKEQLRITAIITFINLVRKVPPGKKLFFKSLLGVLGPCALYFGINRVWAGSGVVGWGRGGGGVWGWSTAK